ncbi:MAG: hypothetical protein IPI67_37265 [Myxococcales bacterium]|nr:hypothetical protein [Myxococcales bacterium]
MKVAMVDGDAAGALITANLIAIRAAKAILAPVLLAYLTGSEGQAALLGRGRSSTLGLSLTPSSLGGIQIPVPPIAVQQQIAELVRAAEQNFVAATRAAEQRRAVAHAVATDLLGGRVPRRREASTP